MQNYETSNVFIFFIYKITYNALTYTYPNLICEYHDWSGTVILEYL